MKRTRSTSQGTRPKRSRNTVVLDLDVEDEEIVINVDESGDDTTARNDGETIPMEDAADGVEEDEEEEQSQNDDPQMPLIADFRSQALKPDHLDKPLWACANGLVIVEAFHPFGNDSLQFVGAIAEPVFRTHLIHSYKITKFSLFTAVALGHTSSNVVARLDQYSKIKLPRSLVDLINHSTTRFGKVKMVLDRRGYSLESTDRELLQTLLDDSIIRGVYMPILVAGQTESSSLPILTELEPEDDDVEPKRRFAFRIQPIHVELVKKRCIDLSAPLLEVYDYRRDISLSQVPLSLKPSSRLRGYQESCLAQIFQQGRGRSGIISLPCGAGKSLVGVATAATVKRSVIVLCTSGVAVEQWRHQFKLWTMIDDTGIARFTSGVKDRKWSATLPPVVISTYSMVSHAGKRAPDSMNMLKKIENQEWGLLILDEVHVVPANTFRKVLTRVRAHMKIGLTATLVREDAMIDDLNFLIGPKLFEANWLDLVQHGHIARVQCAEVWCPMSKEFYREYLNAGSTPRSRLLYIMNPNKFAACCQLVRKHEARGDKILVFSDNIFALVEYATKLGKPYIYGPTPNSERMRILSQFKYDSAVKTLFISKIGDNSIDLPEANVIIQISSHFGSRRQEAQRLGRILRPKSGNLLRAQGEFDAFFYSLVSQDTREMYYSERRQQFLIDQGYAFHVISGDTLITDPISQENELKELAAVLLAEEEAGRIEQLDESTIRSLFQSGSTPIEPTTRVVSSIENLTGGDELEYYEYSTNYTPS